MPVLGWIFFALQETWGSVWPRWLVASIGFVLIYVVFRRYFSSRKIQHTKKWNWRQFGYEVLFSFLMLGVANFIGVAVRFLVNHGYARILHDPLSLATVGTIAWQFAVYFVLFDIYFYFLHRLLHTKALFWIHRVHHQSRVPNPLSAFSFHPIEGLLTGGFVPIMVFFFDLHVYSIIIVNLYGVINSVLVHSGHEFFPRWWYKRRTTGWYLSPMFHDRHHTRWNYNFGGFTTIWDRLLGTVYPAFFSDYDRHHERVAEARLSNPSIAEGLLQRNVLPDGIEDVESGDRIDPESPADIGNTLPPAGGPGRSG